ncbi:BREX-2 system adenine-specific DNA-methyltransferase PglX [Micromonospora carbonacea]|uniref:BREX-2 system adenine-specific DNA-methyltransferase PglX n=1 Tax=Micromonospora carbonacea TaxID=47853 RepID=UPI003D7054A4
MIDQEALRKDLQVQVRRLEKDLVAQIAEVDGLHARLRGEYDRAFGLGRTAASWTEWRDERVTQAAVAWVLGTVFVRFCEDNGLLGDACYLAGPTQDRAVLAEESQDDFFVRHPAKTDRDWLLAGFEQIRQSQAGALLFDKEHNPAYQIPVSHDAAKALIAFWRRRDDDGTLVHDFTDPAWGTRFLGDLYQHLSEAARKTYALLQTPDFVEEFILDLTLTPAIDEFGHDVVKVIDPTCGSGHFLLEVFDRLCKAWYAADQEKDPQEVVRQALLSVHGVDVNPFAVAIARFRLLIAALRAAGFATLAQTKGYVFPLQIATGDSLLRDRQLTLFDDVDELARFRYATEDLDNYPDMLREGRYHVVVGNPPYIEPNKSMKGTYAGLYSACFGAFNLSVPFAQRFFNLACSPKEDGRGSGYTGQITSNAFMKREFGKHLVLRFFGTEVDLTHIIDTSGAFIPDHGTPTVILIGRARRPRLATIRTIRSIRGESTRPPHPRDAPVWSAIRQAMRNSDERNPWVSVGDLSRERYFKRFPWIIQDGGLEIVESIESHSTSKLGSKVERIGYYGDSHADDIFTVKAKGRIAREAAAFQARKAHKGEDIKDMTLSADTLMILPYDSRGKLLPLDTLTEPLFRYLWPYRTTLQGRSAGKGNYQTTGRSWWQWHQLPNDQNAHDLTITYGEIATHNHFAIDRESAVFDRTSPIIKLSKSATESDHIRLLGTLISSTACFWLKQVCHDKGIRGEGGGFTSDDWERFYQFNGTKLKEFPLPEAYPLELARELDAAAQRLTAVSPAAIVAEETPTAQRLAESKREWHSLRGRMIALQEELDWQVYALYGLLPKDLTAPADSIPELSFGERAFEIVLGRKVGEGKADNQWFTRHNSEWITDLPDHWPPEYRAVVQKRIEVIESNRYLALIERPACKRRWATDGWAKLLDNALQNWLLDRCEAHELWYALDENGNSQPRALTVGQLADELSRDANVLAVAGLYKPGHELAKVLTDLIDSEHVPYLSKLRYTASGLTKRAEWESVWAKQRQEDTAPDEPTRQSIRKTIPLPLRYNPGDFRKNSYWGNRGKLDVPKERFISYPGAGRAGDPSLLIGWAGWDHRDQAQALALLIVQRQEADGWTAEQLTPLLAGLHEVLPWVRQWHGEIDPDTGESPADAYSGFLDERLNDLHLTEADLTGWQPPATRGRRRGS